MNRDEGKQQATNIRNIQYHKVRPRSPLHLLRIVFRKRGSTRFWIASTMKIWTTSKLILFWSIFWFSPFVSSTWSQTPATFFGTHIHSGVLGSQPWPPVPMGSIRLWDTYTTWNDLEPSKGVYAWSNFDGYLALAHAHNVDVLYTFGGTAEWAATGSSANCAYGPGSCFPPSNIQDWDDFVTAVVTHAAGKIKYWELWNEPNLKEFWAGDVSTLVMMAQHAYKIIKAAQPSAIILSPAV